MKHLSLTLIGLILTLFSLAQVTFYKDVVSDGIPEVDRKVINSNLKWIYTNEYIEVYNQNMNLQKTITFASLSGQKRISLLAINLFTTNDLYEFIVSIDGQSYVYDENEQLVFDFGEYHPVSVSGNLLLAYTDFYNENLGRYQYKFRYYTLGGSTENIVKLTIGATINSYPNPTNDFLNIIYSVDRNEQLYIYNMNGQLIQSYDLNPKNNSLQISTSQLESGAYIFMYGHNSGSFIVD